LKHELDESHTDCIVPRGTVSEVEAQPLLCLLKIYVGPDEEVSFGDLRSVLWDDNARGAAALNDLHGHLELEAQIVDERIAILEVFVLIPSQIADLVYVAAAIQVTDVQDRKDVRLDRIH
jgi:hypothetical protein